MLPLLLVFIYRYCFVYVFDFRFHRSHQLDPCFEFLIFWHEEIWPKFMWNFNYLLIYKLCFMKAYQFESAFFCARHKLWVLGFRQTLLLPRSNLWSKQYSVQKRYLLHGICTIVYRYAYKKNRTCLESWTVFRLHAFIISNKAEIYSSASEDVYVREIFPRNFHLLIEIFREKRVDFFDELFFAFSLNYLHWTIKMNWNLSKNKHIDWYIQLPVSHRSF